MHVYISPPYFSSSLGVGFCGQEIGTEFAEIQAPVGLLAAVKHEDISIAGMPPLSSGDQACTAADRGPSATCRPVVSKAPVLGQPPVPGDPPLSAEERKARDRERKRRNQRQYRERKRQTLQDTQDKRSRLQYALEQALQQKELLKAQLQSLQTLQIAGQYKEIQPFDPETQGTWEFHPAARSGLVLRNLAGGPLRHQQLINLSLADNLRMCKECILKAKKLLNDPSAGDSESEVGRQLNVLMVERDLIHAYLGAWRPEQMKWLMALPVDGSSQEPSVLPASFYTEQVTKLRLPEVRHQHMGQVFRSYAEDTKKILLERQRLVSLLPDLSKDEADWDAHHQRRSLVSNLRLGQLLRALRQNLENENAREFTMYAMVIVDPELGLTPFHKAQLFLDAFPQTPDLQQLLQAFYQEQEDAAAAKASADAAAEAASAAATVEPYEAADVPDSPLAENLDTGLTTHLDRLQDWVAFKEALAATEAPRK